MDWNEVEPVLVATYRLLADQDQTTPEAVCQELERPARDEQTIRALALLYNDDYIDGITVDQSPAPIFIRPTGKGLRATSGWPGERGETYVAALLEVLDQRIAAPETPELERGRLHRIRDAVSEAGPRFIGEVLAAYTAKIIPPAE